MGHLEPVSQIDSSIIVNASGSRKNKHSQFSYSIADADSDKVLEQITIDANNPLAGKNLVFRVKIHAIRDASLTEIESGLPAEGQSTGIS